MESKTETSIESHNSNPPKKGEDRLMTTTGFMHGYVNHMIDSCRCVRLMLVKLEVPSDAKTMASATSGKRTFQANKAYVKSMADTSYGTTQTCCYADLEGKNYPTYFQIGETITCNKFTENTDGICVYLDKDECLRSFND